MGIRRGVAGAGARFRAARRMGAGLAAAMALAACLWAGAVARPAHGPMEHHATLRNGEVMGSAFLIAPGVALTNAHVVDGLRPGATVTLAAPEGRRSAPARLLAVSRRMDLAILRAPVDFLPPVAGADAEGRAGLVVRAAGVDASGGPQAGTRLELAGAVTAPRAELGGYGPGMIVRMPGVRPGFSGGPVLDGSGRLVGMIAAIRTSRGQAQDAASGYAPIRRGEADEAYVLRAGEIRREVGRLLAAADD